MKIAVGADHAGVPLNETVMAELKRLGHEVVDCGTHDASKPDDYPDYAEAVGRAVLDGKAERAVLICGSGVGASVAANKLPGIRGGLCHDSYSARQGVEHDNMNVLVLGSRIIGEKLAEDLIKNYLCAKFTNEERHVRRLAKVHAIEMRMLKS